MHKRTLSDAAVSVHRIMEPFTWHLSDRKRDAMAGIALRCDCRHAEIVCHTDESRLNGDAARGFASHETMKHSAKQYVRDDVHTNSAEGYSCRKPVPFMLEHLQTSLDCARATSAIGRPPILMAKSSRNSRPLQQNTAK